MVGRERGSDKEVGKRRNAVCWCSGEALGKREDVLVL